MFFTSWFHFLLPFKLSVKGTGNGEMYWYQRASITETKPLPP